MEKAVSAVLSQKPSNKQYLDGNDWNKVLSKAGIKTESTFRPTANEKRSETITTITVGTTRKTDLTVTSSSSVNKNNTRGNAKLEVSYRVTENEKKFLSSIGIDKDLSVEQAIVVLDLMHENGGEISKKELEKISPKATSVSGWEMVYDFAINKGSSLMEMENLYYQEVESKKIEERVAFTAMAITGMFRTNSKVLSNKSVTIESKPQAATQKVPATKGPATGGGAKGDSQLALSAGKAPSGSSLVIEHSPNLKVKFSSSELRAANYMYEQGNKVVLRHPVGTRAEGGTSDLLVNGVKYDVYTPTTKDASRIIGGMAKKNSQTTGKILDLSETTVTPEQLGNVLGRVQGVITKGGKTPNITDIIILP